MSVAGTERTACSRDTSLAHLEIVKNVSTRIENAEASGSGDQDNEIDLFTGWFIDRLENLGNTVYRGASSPLGLKISTNQGLPLILNQEALPQQFLVL
ncbi:hypothetical protein J1N35_041355 [Gossypium stocksii]|uniref:Uncharacterized protein n=1 Tax=Gossypium stocksii TaxID=47602 RepID=A0A9D3ZJ72_9ROSI|nr:hypothetical protein J1N35_041355 [Gossypium stocksii]